MDTSSEKPGRSLWEILRRIARTKLASPDTESDSTPDDRDQPIASPRSLWEVMGPHNPDESGSAEIAPPSGPARDRTGQTAFPENVGGESADEDVPSSAPTQISAPPGEPTLSECSRRALLSLAAGLLSIPAAALTVLDNVVWNLPALVLGFGAVLTGLAALGEIRRSSGEQTGRGLALAGIVLGSIGMFLGPVILTNGRRSPLGNSERKFRSGIAFARATADNQFSAGRLSAHSRAKRGRR